MYFVQFFLTINFHTIANEQANLLSLVKYVNFDRCKLTHYMQAHIKALMYVSICLNLINTYCQAWHYLMGYCFSPLCLLYQCQPQWRSTLLPEWDQTLSCWLCWWLCCKCMMYSPQWHWWGWEYSWWYRENRWEESRTGWLRWGTWEWTWVVMVQKVDLKWLAAKNASFVLFFSYKNTTNFPRNIMLETLQLAVFSANAYMY